VRESLSLAGLPWSALEGRTLAESRPGKALLALVEVAQRQYARSAVLAWVDAAPRAQAGLPGSAWDRLSRAANVVRGVDQWRGRLTNYAARQRELSEQRSLESNEPAASALRREAELAERLATRIDELEAALRNPPDGSSWGQFVAWAQSLWRGQCGGVGVWAEAERPFARDIASTLAELEQADVLEQDTGPSLALFLETLRDTLDARTRPVGQLGKGVLVGPVQSVTGLAFERVYIVGMVEGAFPTPPPPDPFFPTADADPLQLRERHRRSERLTFLTAVAAADGGRLTLSVPDAADGRKAFPSPWLLELAGTASGIRPLLTSQLQALEEAANSAWLRVVTSAVSGASRSPELSDLEDRRLRELDPPGEIHRAPVAQRIDLPLRAGVAASRARSSNEFTAFDGNLAVAALTSARVQGLFSGTRAISASAIENWATCPFQFFLGRVLHVDATERPEDGWTVDPLERGSLIHGILERFFKELHHRGELRGLGAYTMDQRELLERIASDAFADLERRGVTGHPLVWESTAASIRADLRTFLVKDERWRLDNGFEPRYFEQAFGMGSGGSWEPLELEVGGSRVRFRGYIDRIDVSPDGVGHLFDYKTGSANSYRDMERDPVMAGKHAQLALYRRAVLAALPDLARVGAAYWFVSSKGDFKMQSLDQSPLDADRRLAEILDGVAEGIRAGAFHQVPGNETSRPGKFSWDNCVYCDYDRVCPAGRDVVWERKRSEPGYQIHERLAAP
jgi:ATP-dependent helicase/nuclease subunit B